MPPTPRMTGRLLSLVSLLALASLAPQVAHAGIQCPFPPEPAPVVPQFRVEAPGDSLWPLGADGSIVFQPASAITSDRNSVNYNNLCEPGGLFGTERFQDVAVLEDDPRWLFVATNSGLSVWDLSLDPASPRRIAVREGFASSSGFALFPPPGEGDVYVEAIDAVTSPSGSAIYVALAGRSGHGLSLWRFNPQDRSLSQIFQQASRTVRDVELANHGGRTYAFAADPSASRGGIVVFDVTSADDQAGGSPCFDDEFQPNLCPQETGNVGAIDSALYVDLLEAGGSIFAVASDGSELPVDQLHVEIWQVPNPARPDLPPFGESVRRFEGLGDNSRGVQLVEISGRRFLAVIDADLFLDRYTVSAYDASPCFEMGTAGCSDLGPPLWSEELPSTSGNLQFLSASRSGLRTFLYYGLESTPSSGTRLEQLFDITDLPNLGAGEGEIYEVTDAGAQYLDPMSGEAVDYWGDYYSNNTYGLNNVLPRNGRFLGALFYRAANGILDIHRVNLDPPEILFLDDFESGGCGRWSAEVGGPC
ncbi:MAG: hypothetical protein AAF725_07050 [Acidobacteriota bacterium]